MGGSENNTVLFTFQSPFCITIFCLQEKQKKIITYVSEYNRELLVERTMSDTYTSFILNILAYSHNELL